MTKQTIQLGTAPSGTNGDTLRSAMNKVNSNFNELYTEINKALKNDNTSTGHFITNGQIVAGRGSGGVALTNNDGGGNANVCFNHIAEIPEQDGSSGRISTETDYDNGVMVFQVKGGVTKNTKTNIPTLLKLENVNTTSKVTSYGDFYAPSAYSTTTASSPNVFVSSNGRLQRSTSTIRLKTNVQDLVMNDEMYQDFRTTLPIFYQSTADADNPNYWYQSFNADALGEQHPSLVQWESTETIHNLDTGEWEEKPLDKPRAIGLNLNGIVAVQQSAIQYQAKLIEALTTRIEALENA